MTAVFTVELGLTPTSAGLFLLDSSLLDGPDVLAGGGGFVWTDVTNDIIGSLTFRRGASSAAGPYLRTEAGSIAFSLDNQSGKYDPVNMGGPYASQLRPGVAVRVLAEISSGQAPVWVGTVSAWHPNYPAGDMLSTVDVAGVDGIALLQGANLDELPPAGAGDSATDRLDRILDRIGWPAADRNYVTYSGAISTMQETTLAQPAWTEILLTADSDAGTVFIDAAGALNYRGPYNQATTPQLSVDMGSGSIIKWDEFAPAFDVDETWSVAKIARANGSQRTAVSDVGVSQVGYRTYSRTDLICETDEMCEALAQWVVFYRGQPRYRIDSVTIKPSIGWTDTDWLYLLLVEFGSFIRCTQRTPDGRNIVVDGLTRGIEWRVHPAVGEYEVTFNLHAVPTGFTAFTLDSSLLDGAHVLVP